MKTKKLPLFILALSGALVAANARAADKAAPVTTAQLERGQRVYQQICYTCHQPNGQGMPGVYPPLAQSDIVQHNRDRVIDILLSGLQGPVTVKGRTYHNVMPNLYLSNRQIADVVTYISNSWGNQGSATTKQMVAKKRAKNTNWNQSGSPTAQPRPGSGMMGSHGMMGRR